MTAVRALLVVLLCGSVNAAQAPARKDVTVASGRLAHHYFTNDLFRIDKLWMQVEPDTLFFRWLSQGTNRKVEIILTERPGRFGDRPNVRIQSGRLQHATAPRSSPVVHSMFLFDERLAAVGAVTFETDDRGTAMKFVAFDNAAVSSIIVMK